MTELNKELISENFKVFIHNMKLTYNDAAISQFKSIEEVNDFYKALNGVTKGILQLEPRDKKYLLIVTEEDERYENGEVSLTFFADHPEEGKFNSIVEGDNVNELFKVNDIEGLFYQFYDAKNFEKIRYGSIDYDRIEEEIVEYESR